MSTPLPTYKIVLAGDGGVGKSSFCRRFVTGEFTPVYIATLGCEVHPLRFNTNYGPICLNVWDTAGQAKFSGLRDGYYIKADGAIVMCDVTSKNTLKNTTRWRRDIVRMCGTELPMVLVGNKYDVEHNRDQGARDMTNVGLAYSSAFLVSAKSQYNLPEPFLRLARKLTGHSDLMFIAEPTVTEPTTTSVSDPSSVDQVMGEDEVEEHAEIESFLEEQEIETTNKGTTSGFWSWLGY